MEYADQPLSKDTIGEIQKTYGDYIKITADIKQRRLFIGCQLHADGEAILLEKGSRQEDVWGGGIHLTQKKIDATAVMNVRPTLNNPSMEILDPARRENFLTLVTEFFQVLWQN